MKFGMIHHLDNVNFDLPHDDPHSYVSKPSKTPEIYIGAPVWHCPQWQKNLYDRSIPRSKALNIYSQYFNSIELNACFYKIPSHQQIQTWIHQIDPQFKSNFHFVPKLHRSFSFLKKIPSNSMLQMTEDMLTSFSHYAPSCFLQLSPAFSLNEWLILKHWLMNISFQKKLFIEFRHPSFYPHHQLHQEVFKFFQQMGISSVITDTAGHRELLHLSRPTSQVMIRFLGNALHPTDTLRIQSWITVFQKWVLQGVERLYFFIHQPTEAEVPDLAFFLAREIYHHLKIRVRTCAQTFSEESPKLVN